MVESASCPLIDDSFGPFAEHCRGGFDFTLLFEETVLSILPLGLILLVAPFRILYLIKRDIKVNFSRLSVLKLVVYAIYGGIQVALVALWAGPTTTRTNTSIANAVISLIGACALGFLSFVEHHRTIRPSLILELWLFVTLLFDIARVRTLWLQEYQTTIAAVTSVSVGVKAFLALLEAIEKRRLLRQEWTDTSTEATSGFYKKAFFWWLNPLFRKGYTKSLELEELFVLDKHLRSDFLYTTVKTTWETIAPKGPRTLLLLFFKKFKWYFICAVPPRIAYIGFQFCQPFLINRAIDFADEPINQATNNIGYGLIGAYIIVYCGIAISMAQYQHWAYRSITMARGGLISMLFAKTSLLKTTDVDPSSSVTLMSADIERITNGWQTMHEIWANTVEVALAIYLLERQLGSACAIPLAIANASPVSLLGSTLILNLIIARQAEWLEAIERRISATTTMLGSMKRVKMCALTDVFSGILHTLRREELEISKRFRRLLIANMFFSFATQLIAPVLTFAVFSILAMQSGETTLTVSKAYTSLSLFALLSEPLASLLMAMAQFAGSIGCFARIQAFLEKNEHVDERLKPFPEYSEKDQSSQSNGGSSGTSATQIDYQPWGEKKFSTALTEKVALPFSSPEGDALEIYNGNFGFEAEKEPLIKDINLRIPRGKLTMVVGPVGCGKTLLLKAILGELPAITGSVKIYSEDVSYCDQTSFHMNGTIRDSIVAFEDYDDRWYNTVLNACALDEDLQQLPLGDRTRIGSKGVALSGGQSQRLALARAAYARRDLGMLDDILSGLDLETENRVFHNLLGLDGLFRRQRATVILVSSSVRRLPFADHIVVLDEKGRICEQGSFQELNASGDYVSNFDLPAPDWSYEAEETRFDRLMSPATHKITHASTQPLETKALSETELDANRRTGDLSVYKYYVTTVGVTPAVIFMVAICGYVFSMSFPQIWLKWWSDANEKHPNERLGYWLGIYALLSVGGLVALIVGCWALIVTMVPQAGRSFHRKLLNTVLAAPLSFFSTTDTGVTLNRFSQDLQLIDMDLPVSALNFITTTILCVAQVILIAYSSAFAAISFPLWFVALYFIQKYYLRTSRQIRFLDLEAKAPLYSQFTEVLAGLTTVRAFGWQDDLKQKTRQLLDLSQRPFYLLWAVQRWLQLVLDLVVAAIAVMLMVLVVELRGTISGASVGIALLNVILFSQHIKLVIQYWTMLETHIGAVSRIKNFASRTLSEDLPAENRILPNNWPPQGSLDFNNVSASYDSSRMVLKDLTLSIQAGEKIGICGRTGSGKSSFILAIFRMIELHGGSISIDGIDIATVPRNEVRSRIIGLPQDTMVLSGTVRLNLDPYNRSSDGAIIDALDDVRLWSVIEERGGLDADMDVVSLSHGQRQLLCLAQALLRSSSILILDEATSSVDDVTDGLIQKIIRQKFSKHTIIAVAHKLDTITDFDKVAVLENGNLKEFDSPHTLLSQSSSAFRQLYNTTVKEKAVNADDQIEQ
ncbi:uncharacterized protein KY384_005631 [Bacidia gigantensis]|uniref:uncharacterized protein n=1 Tax=Bacidia gigantensis TaxID=2732470 RepID=UPI001D055F48|nr:uncharacterized protein KY384_005631 [Bacidia gigantensis]KAG8530148.1 hypothetical protein KY384_005631 [Bacidia gigantensis]